MPCHVELPEFGRCLTCQNSSGICRLENIAWFRVLLFRRLKLALLHEFGVSEDRGEIK